MTENQYERVVAALVDFIERVAKDKAASEAELKTLSDAVYALNQIVFKS